MGGGEGIEIKEREEEGRERSSTFSLVFFGQSDLWFLLEQEGKFFLAARASSRDRNRGVSTNFKR